MRVAVLGGGNLGIAAASSLADEGFSVALFEKSSSLGGVASSFTVRWDGEEYHLPKAYRHFSLSSENRKTLGSLDQGEIITLEGSHRRAIYLDGHLFPADSLRDLVRARVPLNTKVQASVIFLKNPQLLASPVALASFKNIREYFLSRERELRRKGVKVRKGADITKIDFRKGRLRSRNGKSPETFDCIVTTIPPEAIESIAEPGSISSRLRARLRSMRPGKIVSLCVGLEMDTGLPYITCVRDRGCPFQELVDYTGLSALPLGKSLLYLQSYRPEMASLADEEVKRLFLDHLQAIYPGTRGRISWSRVFRFPPSRRRPIIDSLSAPSGEILSTGRSHFLCREIRERSRISLFGYCLHAARAALFKGQERTFGLVNPNESLLCAELIRRLKRQGWPSGEAC